MQCYALGLCRVVHVPNKPQTKNTGGKIHFVGRVNINHFTVVKNSPYLLEIHALTLMDKTPRCWDLLQNILGVGWTECIDKISQCWPRELDAQCCTCVW